ncbi:MAG TPA: STAS domain-containing protein [Patescibacteria group bacterium]|nr:STAS domain-containing protein [Patescibacteria group bacterium]
MESKRLGAVCVLQILTKVDGNSSREVEVEISRIWEEGNRKLICDLSQTEYISSAGLRVFLSALKRSQKAGGQMILCGLKPGILEIFNMAGFTGLFQICEREGDAFRRFE